MVNALIAELYPKTVSYSKLFFMSWSCKIKRRSTYRWKIDRFTGGSSPPLWYPHFPGNTTHWSPLVRHPINCHVRFWFPLIVPCRHHTRSESIIIDIFDPGHCGIMNIWLVTGADMIDSNLNFKCFVRIKHIRLEANDFTMRISQWRNVWHVTATSLERKSFKKWQ